MPDTLFYFTFCVRLLQLLREALTVRHRLASHPRSSSLSLPSAGITGVQHRRLHFQQAAVNLSTLLQQGKTPNSATEGGRSQSGLVCTQPLFDLCLPCLADRPWDESRLDSFS